MDIRHLNLPINILIDEDTISTTKVAEVIQKTLLNLKGVTMCCTAEESANCTDSLDEYEVGSQYPAELELGT